jgi:hypothetical protein
MLEATNGETGRTPVIRRIGDTYVVLRETIGRRFGSHDARPEAERRLRRIERFKRLSPRALRPARRGAR